MVYLNSIESDILNNASYRDKVFYKFLNGDRSFVENYESDLETKVCISAFSNKENANEALEKLRSFKPVKGLHYSGNIISLVASALIDFNGEKQNLSQYIKNHSSRDKFIICSALKSDFGESPLCANRPLDALSEKMNNNQMVEECDIQPCLSEIKDIYDLYVVKSAIVKSIFQKSGKEYMSDFNSLYSLNKKLDSRLGFLINCCIATFIIPVVFFVGFKIFKYFSENWDWLEPITYLMAVVLFLISAVLKIKYSDLVYSFVKSIFEKVHSIFYSFLGINYASLKRLLEKLSKYSKE